MRETKYIIILSVCLLSIQNLLGQKGVIKGLITDSTNSMEIIGAAVKVAGTDLGVITNFDGVFIIPNVSVGKATLEISFISYATKRITVNVTAKDTVFVKTTLASNEVLLKAAVIKAERLTNTQEAVLFEIRDASQVVSGISSQQIHKSQDNNAAQVMQRVPGVTIMDNRFVMIRGLSERYNNIMINNVIAPSTEVNKRTFSFDLIPSGALDRMMVYKSGSAELPGDFAGGVIKVYTVENIEERFFKIGIGTGIRAGTTFNPYYQSQGSSTDFLGFDNGFRALPDQFPSTRNLQNSPRNSQLRKDAAHSLPNNFETSSSTVVPDFSFGISFGEKFNIGKVQVTGINSVGYSQSYQYYKRDFHRYFEWVDEEQPIIKRFEFEDDTYEKQVKINALSNWTFKFNDKHKIKFKNLFNQIGENETIIRNGEDFIQRPGDELRNYLLGYRSRSIYSGQLEGIHEFTDRKNLSWVIGSSYLKEDEPDLRRFRTFRPEGVFTNETEGFQMQLPPSSNLFETGRYYGNLNEYSINHGTDYIYNLDNRKKEGKKLKVGYYTDARSRSFSSRYMSYLYPGFFDPAEGERIRRLPLNEIFSPENLKTENGLILEEGTRPIDEYTASNHLAAAYIGFNLPINTKWSTSLGFRGEYNVQSLQSLDDATIIEVNNPIMSSLPFFNLSYNISKNSIVRVAYGRTVNRPEFRELAPFLYYDYKMEAGVIGNPNLKTATIDNLDLRYEVYPRPGETISLGSFYKKFTNPIENRTIITTESPQFTFINADAAFNYGLELEFRKSLQGLTSSTILNNFSFNINSSVIRSQVDLGATAVAQDQIRPLQGQSPYIVNAAVYYNDEKRNLSVSAVYNIIGERIYSVGDVLFPTIYELPRNSIDLTITKKISKQVTFKMGFQDLLNAPFRFYQDSNRDGKITASDDPVFTFRRGTYSSFLLAVDLYKTKK
jgi:hypothetical protein